MHVLHNSIHYNWSMFLCVCPCVNSWAEWQVFARDQYYNLVWPIFSHVLKSESRHNANFVITGSTGGCHNHNLQCYHWLTKLALCMTILTFQWCTGALIIHYNDVIMSVMASQITSLTIVYSGVYSGADQRKHQSSTSLAFVRGIHRWPVNSPHKGPVMQKMFTFDDVIMVTWLYPRPMELEGVYWNHLVDFVQTVQNGQPLAHLWRQDMGHLVISMPIFCVVILPYHCCENNYVTLTHCGLMTALFGT